MEFILKVTMAMYTTGCEFNSLQYKTVDERVLREAKDFITEQALRATLDADAAVSRLGGPHEQSLIVIDSTSTITGVHLSGAGCAENSTVQSGSSCTVSKPGWNCSSLSCEATRWGQAKCIPDGETVLTNDFPGMALASINWFDHAMSAGCSTAVLKAELPDGAYILGGSTSCLKKHGNVLHGHECKVSREGFTCSSVSCHTGKFNKTSCQSNGQTLLCLL